MNIVQELIAQVSTKELLQKYLTIAIPTVLNSIEEVAIKTLDDEARKNGILELPTWHGDKNSFPVIRIGGWYMNKEKENSYFNGYKPWMIINRNRPGLNPESESVFVDIVVSNIISIIEHNHEMWNKQFYEKLGDGFNDGFNQMDGSIETGYQISAGHTFPEEITISLVHIYYGK